MTRHVLVRECPPSPKSMNIMGVDLNSCCITVFLLIKASSWRSSFLASNHSKEREVHSVHTRQSCPKLLYERCMWIPPPTHIPIWAMTCSGAAGCSGIAYTFQPQFGQPCAVSEWPERQICPRPPVINSSTAASFGHSVGQTLRRLQC